MPRGKLWSAAEAEYLENNWGLLTVPQLARKMGRSEQAIRVKISRFQLGPCTAAAGALSAYDVAGMLDVDVHTVIRSWIGKYGLKARRRKPGGSRNVWFIEHDALSAGYAITKTCGIAAAWKSTRWGRSLPGCRTSVSATPCSRAARVDSGHRTRTHTL